ncbi:MAG: DUF4350 domain-containing protein, partial [Acidimicrobiales bacterium]
MNDRIGALAFWAGLVVVLVVVAVLAASGTNDEPLDPRSVSGDGAKALVDLMESFDAGVELGVDLPTPDHDVAVLLLDAYGLADRDALEAWVREGHTLVVADPGSPLTPRLDGLDPTADAEPCALAALQGVDLIVGATSGYRAPPDGEVCLGGAVAGDPLGRGTIVSL